MSALISDAERERRHTIALAFTSTALAGDVEAFLLNVAGIDWPGAWLDVFTVLAPVPRDLITDDIRRAFLWAWRGDHDHTVVRSDAALIGSDWTMTKDVDHNPDLLIRCMRIMAPSRTSAEAPYLLYRGQSHEDHQRGLHGVWWTPDPLYAEILARRSHRAHVGQGAVLAIITPPDAVVWELNPSELILDPSLLRDVLCVAVPPRYSDAEEAMTSIQREQRSSVLGLPHGSERELVRMWMANGTPARGLEWVRETRLDALTQELAA